jgi:TonB family protein
MGRKQTLDGRVRISTIPSKFEGAFNMIGLMVMAAALSAAQEEPIAPTILNMKEMFSGGDYPMGALMLEQEGTTVVSIAVNERGKVTACNVDISSGSAALDARTCQIFRGRAKFTPAHDSSGRPVASVFLSRITWRVEDSELPVAPWAVRVLALVNPNSSMRDCGVEGGGALLRSSPRGVIECSALAGAFAVSPELLQKVAGHETILAFDKQFVPAIVNSIGTPRDLRRYTFLGREIVNLKIGPDGTVLRCVKKSAEGPFPPTVGACESLPHRKFEVPLDGNGKPASVWATAAMSVYSKP